MCVVSMIVDHYWDKWHPYRPEPPYRLPSWPDPNPLPQYPLPHQVPSKLPSPEEIAEFHELLRKAREYDKRNNEPPCESEEKKKRLKDLADELGVKISFD